MHVQAAVRTQVEVVKEQCRASARDVVNAVFAAVEEFRGETPANDDMTAVAVRIRE